MLEVRRSCGHYGAPTPAGQMDWCLWWTLQRLKG
ncbi:hypothetical protein LEMLEM_LOCUS27493 [Lemmus lemmus]